MYSSYTQIKQIFSKNYVIWLATFNKMLQILTSIINAHLIYLKHLWRYLMQAWHRMNSKKADCCMRSKFY